MMGYIFSQVEKSWKRSLLLSVAFVAGLSTVFTALGAVSSAFDISAVGGRVAGVVLLVRARTSGVGFKINIAKPELSDARTILTEQRDQLNARLEEISGEIKTLASEFGIGDDPSTRDVAEQAASLERALSRRITFETRAAAVGEEPLGGHQRHPRHQLLARHQARVARVVGRDLAHARRGGRG